MTASMAIVWIMAALLFAAAGALLLVEHLAERKKEREQAKARHPAGKKR